MIALSYGAIIYNDAPLVGDGYDEQFRSRGLHCDGLKTFLTRWLPYSHKGEFYHQICIPLWIVTAILGLSSWITFYPWRKRRRIAMGFCGKCGYNVKGSPQPRCPECGTEFDPALLEKFKVESAKDGTISTNDEVRSTK